MGAVTSGQISVAQGFSEASILGPVLLLLFVNDISRLYRNMSTITIDADYTSLSQSSIWSDMSTLSPLLSQNLKDIEKIGLEKAKRIRTLTSI